MKSINFERIEDINIAHKVLQILWPDFVEIDGSVFLKENDPDKEVMKTYPKRSSYEWICNMVYIFLIFQNDARSNKKQYFKEDINKDHLDYKLGVDIGKKMAFLWYQKLRIEFPHYRFRIYYFGTIVSFTRVWPDEQVVDEDELYKDIIADGEAVIYDTEVSHNTSD